MNNKHPAVSRAFHWNLPFMFVFSRAICKEVIDQKDEFFQGFSKFQHNRKHRQHETQHQEYLRKIHQSFYIWEYIRLLYSGWSYLEHWEEQGKKLHNKRILYRLHPIYRQRMIHFIVEGLPHIEWLFTHWFRYKMIKELLKSIKIKQGQYDIMGTGHVRIMSNIATKPTVLVLSFLKPSDNFVNFFLW